MPVPSTFMDRLRHWFTEGWWAEAADMIAIKHFFNRLKAGHRMDLLRNITSPLSK